MGFAAAFAVACVAPELTGWATLGGGLVALGSQLHLNLFVTGRRHAAPATD